MSFPIEKLLIIFEERNLNRSDVNAVVASYSTVARTIIDDPNKEKNVVRINEYIRDNLKPLGFDTTVSFYIIDYLSDIFRSNVGQLEVSPGTEGSNQESNEETTEDSSLNVVGKFMMFDDNGAKRHYEKNDVVYYEGKTYIASDDVSGWVPESMHPENNWNPIDLPDNTIDGEEF